MFNQEINAMMTETIAALELDMVLSTIVDALDWIDIDDLTSAHGFVMIS